MVIKKKAIEREWNLHGKVTVFAEGCRGHLGKQLIKKYKLDKEKNPQQYGIGFKEIWEVNDQAASRRFSNAYSWLAT